MKKYLLLLAFNAIVLFQMKAQETTDPEVFTIYAHLDGNKLEMECALGCNWTKLGFSLLKMGRVQQVNENGMATMEDKSSQSVFLFDVLFDGKTITLIGHKGTTWKKLSFSLMEGQKAIIDQEGFKGYK